MGKGRFLLAHDFRGFHFHLDGEGELDHPRKHVVEAVYIMAHKEAESQRLVFTVNLIDCRIPSKVSLGEKLSTLG